MNAPLVSVIIPIYNVEAFLQQCLDSVVSQAYTNLEIILVNDGSPDNSDSICREYTEKYSNIVYVKQDNAGLSAARNHGINIAKGDYIFFLDSDDYLSSDCIQSLVDSAMKGFLPIIGFEIDFSDKSEIVTPKQSYGTYNSVGDFLQDFHKYFATKSNFAWGKLYRADVIKNNKLVFLEGVSLVEDILFNIQYYKCCNCGIEVVPCNGYYYRQHGAETLSKKFNIKMFEWNELGYSSIRDYLNEYEAMTAENRYHFYQNIFGNLLYSIELLVRSTNYSLAEKAAIINNYTSTQLAKEVFLYSTSNSIQSRIARTCLSEGHPYLHIFTVKIINLLKKLKHAYH